MQDLDRSLVIGSVAFFNASIIAFKQIDCRVTVTHYNPKKHRLTLSIPQAQRKIGA